MLLIKSILAFAAIFAAAAALATGIAGAVPTAGYGLPWRSIPKADRIAAELASSHTSAPLSQFGLIHVRAIPPRCSTGWIPTPGARSSKGH
jgi:hypothetical protein